MRSLQVILLCIVCVAQLNARTELLKDSSLDDPSSDPAASVGARTYDEELDDDSAEWFFYDNTLPLESHETRTRFRRGTRLAVNDRLRVMTFNIQNYANFGKINTRDQEIIKILRQADLAVLQELRNMDVADALVKELNKGVPPPMYNQNQSGPLPPEEGTRHEHYTFIYKENLLRVTGTKQLDPYEFSTGKKQTRPPFAVMFQYSDSKRRQFNFNVLPVHTIPDSRFSHTTREEIDDLYTKSEEIKSFPCCASKNTIILGDFNQSPSFVKVGFQSELDKDGDTEQIEYIGSSSATKDKDNNQLDRIYVQGQLTNAIDCKATVHRSGFTSAISDHYPLSFDIDVTKMATAPTASTPCTASRKRKGRGGGACPRSAKRARIGRKRRQADNSTTVSEEEDCEVCLSMQFPAGGVFPEGANSSLSIFNVSSSLPPAIQRGDEEFFSLFHFEGDFILFRNEEAVGAEWCGSPGRPCPNCSAGSFIDDIVDQCADRIMCPVLAGRLMDLSLTAFSCFPNRTVIVHQAWDEADSNFIEGHTAVDSLYRRGQELEISISEEGSEESDSSLLSELASLALCNGFDYVRINRENGTLSVAVRQCSEGNSSIITCVEPLLSNGRYLNDNGGSIFQEDDNIYAVCTPGYVLTGPILRECQSNMEWSDEEPSCDLVCPDLPVPDCASPVYDYVHGTVTFQCQSGCVPKGVNSPLRCDPKFRQFVGESTFTCDPVTSTCPILQSPENSHRGWIYGTPGLVGSVLQFSCFKGLHLVGEQRLTCQEDLNWNYPVPSCNETQQEVEEMRTSDSKSLEIGISVGIVLALLVTAILFVAIATKILCIRWKKKKMAVTK